ncbi:MAG: coiled-coil domain-containing protein [Planctomycetota bacterium]
MSSLTKILIVLLTISSIFLCGIVVTYVANADNYRKLHTELRAERDSFRQKFNSSTKDYNEKKAEMEQLEDKLNNEIASITKRLKQLQSEFKIIEAEKEDALRRVNSWAAIVRDFYETNDKQGQLLKNTLAEKTRLEAEKEKNLKSLDELTTSLEEKMAIIVMLDDKTKRLLEEKAELQGRLDKLLLPFDKRAVEPVPITPEKTIAQPTIPKTRDIELKGLIKAVDLKNSMASITIGNAAGVKVGMKFHVTRGDMFICDILIIDVDAEEAVGILELIKQQPKVNDNISTNL